MSPSATTDPRLELGLDASGGAVAAGCSVLVIVDVQTGFLTREVAWLPAAVEAASVEYDRVVVVSSRNDATSPWRTLLGWRGLPTPQDRALAPEVARLVARGALWVEKKSYSAAPLLLGTHNDKPLLRAGDRVHLAGLELDACVLATCFGLFDAGVDVSVRLDLCATTAGDDAHESTVSLMRRQFGSHRVVDGL